MDRLRINEVLETSCQWDLVPLNETEESQKNFIGKFKGQFFIVDGSSRNKRFYGRDLWENSVLRNSDVQKRLSDLVVYGTIGHEEREVTEEDLRKGEVSHIVTGLWIDESTAMGMGEAIILDTPAGRNLLTYLKAGSKLKPSSRATGTLMEETDAEGNNIVDPRTYKFETFDLVLEPGIESTNISLTERLSKENKERQMGAEATGSGSFLNEAAIREKLDLERRLEDANRRNSNLQEKLEIAESRGSKFEKILRDHNFAEREIELMLESYKGADEALAIARTAKANPGLIRTLVEHPKLNEELEELASYQEIGSVEDIEAAFKAAEEELDEYHKLGTAEEITETIKKAKKRIDDGSAELSEYRKLGKPQQIAEALKSAKALNERISAIGSVEDIELGIRQGAKLLKKYASFGSPIAISEKLSSANARAEKYLKERNEMIVSHNAKRLSEKYNVSVEKAAEIIREKKSVKAAADLFESFQKKEEEGKPVNESASTAARPARKAPTTSMNEDFVPGSLAATALSEWGSKLGRNS